MIRFMHAANRLGKRALALAVLLLPLHLAAATQQPASPAQTADQDQNKAKLAPPLVGPYTEIIVTASRTAESIGDVPQSMSVLGKSLIDVLQARTPNMMLREEPGIYTTQVATQGTPIIRGQMGNRVLYLWDGIRINNGALFSGPNGFFNQIPDSSVERMEVIRGPGAVQYGSDAIGGVINILTRSADEYSKTVQAGGTAEFRGSTGDSEKSGLAEFWLASRRVTFMGSYTGQDVGDYRAPLIGRQANTGFDAEGGDISLGFKVRANEVVRLSWIHDRRYNVETYAQSKLNASLIPRIFGPFEQRGIAKADYDFTDLSRLSRDLRMYTYYQYYDALRDQTVETSTLFNKTRTDTSQRVWGGGVQNESTAKTVRLVYGSDYRTEWLLSDKTLTATPKAGGPATLSIPNGNVPPGNYDVFDAFGIAQIRPARGLAASMGVRLESSHLISAPRPQDALTPFTVDTLRLDKRWNAATWSAGAVYHFNDVLSLSGNIATGFRAPTFSDTLSTGVPVFASGIASVPSPNVKPERSITYELGPRYSARTLDLSLTAYTTQLTDLLAAQATGTINIPGIGIVVARKNLNVSSGYVRGVEASWAWQVTPSLDLYGHGTFTRGQDTFQNVPLRFIPPLNGMMAARWTTPRQRWWIEANMILMDRLRRHAPDDELDAGFSMDPGYGSPSVTNPAYRPSFEMPGYAVTNLRTGFNMRNEKKRDLEVFVNFGNLFNVRYREPYAQQELLAPGFSALIGTRFRF